MDVRARLLAWLGDTFVPCACEGRCSSHVEFLWRARFKDDLVAQFRRTGAEVGTLALREMLPECLAARGFSFVLADTSHSKVRVRFPDGRVRRVTGVAFGLRRRRYPEVPLAVPVARARACLRACRAPRQARPGCAAPLRARCGPSVERVPVDRRPHDREPLPVGVRGPPARRHERHARRAPRDGQEHVAVCRSLGPKFADVLPYATRCLKADARRATSSSPQ